MADKHFWCSQEYHLPFMPHMEEEATTMMHNIIPLIIFKYGDNMKNYFFTEAVEAAKDDY